MAIARITAREIGLPPVRLTIEPAADLRALLDYLDDLMVERTALVNRVHAELTGPAPGYQQQIRSLTSRPRVQAALELLTGDEGIRADLCRRRLERVLQIDAEAAAVKRQIAVWSRVQHRKRRGTASRIWRTCTRNRRKRHSETVSHATTFFSVDEGKGSLIAGPKPGRRAGSLPIWHEISRDEIATQSPSLVDKIARNTAVSTVAEIADEIAQVVNDATNDSS